MFLLLVITEVHLKNLKTKSSLSLMSLGILLIIFVGTFV